MRSVPFSRVEALPIHVHTHTNYFERFYCRVAEFQTKQRTMDVTQNYISISHFLYLEKGIAWQLMDCSRVSPIRSHWLRGHATLLPLNTSSHGDYNLRVLCKLFSSENIFLPETGINTLLIVWMIPLLALTSAFVTMASFTSICPSPPSLTSTKCPSTVV